jgi:diaminopimelate decarboxylase
MKLFGTQKINKYGHLEIGGCDVVELAKEFSTPLYILDEELIRKNCKTYLKEFQKRVKNFAVVYAGKANISVGICQIMKEEGLFLDVVSGGEIYTALKTKFPTEKIFFHGNNKSKEEIIFALKNNIGRIVVDSEDELEILQEIAKKFNKKQKILLRVTPGIKPKTHTYIQTGQIDSKFGLGIDNGEALRVIEKIKNFENLFLTGIHCHIGSQIFELKSFEIAAKIMIEFREKIREKIGFYLEEVNLGGGLGIRYTEDDNPPSISQYVDVITKSVKDTCKKFSSPLPKIIVEPGRSIIGEAGITAYTVGVIKEIPGIRKYVVVDGGMADNPRPALYSAKYQAIIANKANKEREEIVSIAGKCCESGDILIQEIKLPKVERGDILVVFSTGAYNYSMASNYNRLPRPATVLVKNGRAKLLVKRESYQDLVRNELI